MTNLGRQTAKPRAEAKDPDAPLSGHPNAAENVQLKALRV